MALDRTLDPQHDPIGRLSSNPKVMKISQRFIWLGQPGSPQRGNFPHPSHDEEIEDYWKKCTLISDIRFKLLSQILNRPQIDNRVFQLLRVDILVHFDRPGETL
jgi:hypothetical protein